MILNRPLGWSICAGMSLLLTPEAEDHCQSGGSCARVDSRMVHALANAKGGGGDRGSPREERQGSAVSGAAEDC